MKKLMMILALVATVAVTSAQPAQYNPDGSPRAVRPGKDKKMQIWMPPTILEWLGR